MDFKTQKIIHMQTIKDNSKDSLTRIYNTTKRVFELFDEYKAEFFTLEDVYANKNMKAYNLLSRLRGMLIYEAMNRELLFEIPLAKQWRSTCGINEKGRENQKAAALKFVKDKFDIDLGKNDDQAESVCIAWAMSLKYKDYD